MSEAGTSESVESKKETIERLLSQHASESISVSPGGTSTSVTNLSIDQAINALEFLQSEEARQSDSPGFKVKKIRGNSTR